MICRLSLSKNIERLEDLATNTIKEIVKSYTYLIKSNIDFTEIENKIQELVNHCSTLCPK